ncbi:MAG: DUF3892 domain-containing protein [Candidatus Margulisiibacteriota bacterium]
MRIILVVCDKNGRNVLFILDDLQALNLKEAIVRIKKGEIFGAEIVKTKKGVYLRANPNHEIKDNLDYGSIAINALKNSGKKRKSLFLKIYGQHRKELLRKKEEKKKKVIYIEGQKKGAAKEALAHLSKHKKNILAAARQFKIDPNILGAILIDEYFRMDIVDRFDWLAVLGFDRSVGIAQIKIETARELIKKGYYNPNPYDKNLSQANISKTSRKNLYRYVENPKHSIYFAAAIILRIIDEWAPFVDLSNRPEIIGTLYSLGKKKKPHSHPESVPRGEQIKNEFYKIAKKALKS